MRKNGSRKGSRLCRKVPPPNHCKHNTLDNTEMFTTFICRWCKETTLVSDQYDSHPGICIDCWDEDTSKRSIKKRYHTIDYLEERDRKLAEMGSLEEFLNEQRRV